MHGAPLGPVQHRRRGPVFSTLRAILYLQASRAVGGVLATQTVGECTLYV